MSALDFNPRRAESTNQRPVFVLLVKAHTDVGINTNRTGQLFRQCTKEKVIALREKNHLARAVLTCFTPSSDLFAWLCVLSTSRVLSTMA